MDFSAPLDFYCERTSPDFWAEPLNAFSNIAIFGAGVYYFMKSLRRSSGKSSKFPLWTFVFAILVMIVGAGSFVFHTFANQWSHLCDLVPILVLQTIFVGFAFRKLLKFHLGLSVIIAIAFCFVTLKLAFPPWSAYVNGSLCYIPTVIFFAYLWFGLKQRKSELNQLALLATIVFIFGFTARTIDNSICEQWIYGTHFIWHTLNGAMLFILLKLAKNYEDSIS